MNATAWNAALDAEPPRGTRAVGRWLLWVGCAAMLAGIFLTPPWGLFGFACAVLGAILSRPPLLASPVLWVGAAFGLWILASNLAGMAAGTPGATRISSPAYAWLAVPLTTMAAVDPRWRRAALRLLIVAGGLSLAVAALQFLIGLGEGPLKIDPAGDRLSRARGFSSLHLSYGFAGAVLAALVVPGGLGAAWDWSGRAIALLGVGICGARACMLGAIAGIAAALSMRGWRWLLAGIAIAVVLAGALYARMAATDDGRLRAMLAGQDGRLPIWRTTAAMIAEHPGLGYGHRNAYKAAYNAAYERVAPGPPNEFSKDGAPHAHNWFLALAVEHGVLAPFLHLALLGTVLVLLWRRRREAPEAFQAGCGLAAAAVVCSCFEPFPTQAAPGMGFHAALGFVLGWSYGDSRAT